MGQHGAETGELLEVSCDQRRQPPGTAIGQAEPDDAMVVGVQLTLDEAGEYGAVDQAHDAVVSQQQVISHITNGGCTSWVSSDGEEQLVLTGGDPGIEGVLLTPAEEVAQAVSEFEQLLIVGV